MPRPKSNLTGGRPRSISVRWTDEQHVQFLRLGGSDWLRNQINAHLPVDKQCSPKTIRDKRDAEAVRMRFEGFKLTSIATDLNVSVGIVCAALKNAGIQGCMKNRKRYERA